MIYIILLIILFALALKERTSNINRLYLPITVILILFIGLSRELGGDRPAYIAEYDYASSFNMGWSAFLKHLSTRMLFGRMPLWNISVMLFHSIFPKEFIVFQFVHVAFVNGVIFWFFKQYSNRRFLCLFFYCLLCFMAFSCEILRESTAVAIGLLAVPSLIKKEYFKYYTLCIIAFGFHASAFILFLFPLIPHIKPSIKKIILFSSAIIAFCFLGNGLVYFLGGILNASFLGERFNDYFDSALNFNGLLYNLVLLYILPCYFFLYLSKHKKNPSILLDKFISIYFILGAGITALLTFNRLFNYLYVLLIIVYVLIFADLSKKRGLRYSFKKIVLILIILFNPVHSIRQYFIKYGDHYFYEFYVPYSTTFDNRNVSYRESLRETVFEITKDKYQREQNK